MSVTPRAFNSSRNSLTLEKSSSHMGNGESSNRAAVALLADAEGFLRHAPVGDIALAALYAYLTSALVEHGTPRCGNPFDPAVPGDHAVLLLVEGMALEQAVPISRACGRDRRRAPSR